MFTGRDDEARKGAVLVYDAAGRLTYVGAEAGAPKRGKDDRLIDHSGHFVMPGLIDVHTHLAYGNAKTEEDIDLYSPLEFRALRGMFFAQKVARVVAAGYTAICSPGDAGQISLSDPQRDQRPACSTGARARWPPGRARPTHQGLHRLVYPTWHRRARNLDRQARPQPIDAAIQEIRRQVKNGVDLHQKIAMDGIQRRPDGELIAAFTQEEHRRDGARETHRMGKKAVSHAVGREATLYSARAGNRSDLSRLPSRRRRHRRDEKDRQRMLSPTLTQPKNVIEFTQPHEPAGQKGRVEATAARYQLGCANWCKARRSKAGIPFLTGTDSGLFAVTTAYGGACSTRASWTLFVDDLGFTKAGALRAGDRSPTPASGSQGDEIGVLEPGPPRSRFHRLERLAARRASPSLQDKSRLRGVYIAGREIAG